MEHCALYIHIPFCRSKCRYCDFASYPHRENCWDSYLTAVLKEADEWQARMAGKIVPTVFFGGGTPTLLPPEMIISLLDGLRERFVIADDAEITIEGNPGTVTLEGLRRLREAGFNRISFGAQAMEDWLLKGIGRIHTVAETEQAVTLAREAGFDNLSLDLIYGLPGQSLDDWRLTLERATALSPEHISAYSLIVEEGTPLYDDVEAGKVAVPDDDQVVEMQRLGNRLLADKGYARYEISNYARTGRECRHNLTYWQCGDYLGLGVAAHSLFENERFENPRDLDAYLAGEHCCERIALTEIDRYEETVMLFTRLTSGLDLDASASVIGRDFVVRHQKKIDRLTEVGLVELKDGHLRLTEHGLELQNAVVVELLD